LRADTPPQAQSLKMADILAWKSIRTSVVTNDGKWLAYRLAPNEGDSEVILRQVQGDKEHRFPAGEARGPALPPGFGPAVPADLVVSEDSQWAAFTVYPTRKEAKAAEKTRKPLTNKVALVNLATGAKTEFENVRRFGFSGEMGTWLALHKNAAIPQATPATPASPTPAPTSPAAPRQDADKWAGSDLLLHELATGNELNLGNVSEFAFDKKGQWLALVIDAQGQAGNGVQLRNMTTGVLLPLDNAKAWYKGLTWTEKGDGLAVLRGVEDKAWENKLYSLVAFTAFTAQAPRKIVFDPKADKTFPALMTISPDRSPTWTEDLGGVLFGIHELKKKDDKPTPKEPDKAEPKKDVPAKADGDEKAQRAPPAARQGGADGDPDKPDLVIWHYQDERLQSQQQVQADQDKSFSYLCVFRVKDRKFHRLADDTLKQVSAAPKQRWAIGLDERAYQLMGTLDGRRYQDVYVVDLETGQRRLALKKCRWYMGPSPEGSHFLYYEDGHYYTHELATGKSYCITRDVPATFVDEEDDHNVTKPPQRPIGWVKDGVSVLLSDGWDVWNLPAHGGPGVNLTLDGRKDNIRYRRRYVLDRDEKGIDLSGSVYLSAYGEWTKKGGIVRIDGGKSSPARLLWDDAEFATLLKAKKADVFLVTHETNRDYPDYYATDSSFEEKRRLTHANPQQDKFAWSKGAVLVNYTSAKGQKLQGALFLPANYEENKRYPTIVYIYEKLSQDLNRYDVPGVRRFSRSVYTSNGYAVFMPDIKYQINDPGRSAVWCVLPALEAAIATGVVDRERVGLHGHSWGGYQTSFLITQTDAFKAAIAGAPLTNLISMYSSIYWNTGSANQPIFESSQGRFTQGYWEDVEAYARNSPVYFARNVKTPLLLLHNDKDGAVDWNQGIEYFNTLRRLRKPVVMLQYKGENHGLAKAANQKDYAVRMREFFDHYLREQPAPAWLKEGVPHLKHEEHIKERVKEMKE
jgi:dipeptidyl aminopeptidase/acylaminoacyl peptidase